MSEDRKNTNPEPLASIRPDDESFLGRWSRRKTMAARGEISEPEELLPSASLPPVAAEAPPPLTDADMPALETLDENSDFGGFLSPGVSDVLRKKALKKLFGSAGMNLRDGLDDYDDDFTFFEPLGDIVTADMRHQAELEAERQRLALEQKAAAADADAAQTEAADDDTTSAQDGSVEEQSADAQGLPPPADDAGESLAGRTTSGEGLHPGNQDPPPAGDKLNV